MKTVEKNPARIMRQNATRFYNPWNRFLRNDFLDFWDDDIVAGTIPAINSFEEKDRYKVEMAAPGLKKEDFSIDIDGNIMTISCQKESENENGKNGNEERAYSRKEYSYVGFSRSFTLPDYADTSRIVAKYSDGILSLAIPKKPEAQKNKSQKIAVQ